MIQHSETITKLMKAIHQVQGVVDGVAKDSKNPHFKNRYASLEAVVDTIRRPCQDAGLVIMQAPGAFSESALSLTTMITHAESGEWLKSTFQVPVAKADPQGVGSALTYSERYSLMALFNLPAVDDDAESARYQPPQRTPAQEAVKGQLTASLAVVPEPSGIPEYVSISQALLDTISSTTSDAEMDALVRSAAFKADLAKCPPREQERIKTIGTRHRGTFRKAVDLTAAG